MLQPASGRRPVSVQGPSFGPSARSPRYLTLGPSRVWRNGVGLRGYGGTRVPGYKVTCLTTTTACAPCTPRPRPARLQPAAQSHPSHPTFCSKGGSPKTSLLPLGFFGIVAAPGRGGALAGWVDGLGERRPCCYVGPPRLVQWFREGVTARTALFGFLGTCHKRGRDVRLLRTGLTTRQHVELNSLYCCVVHTHCTLLLRLLARRCHAHHAVRRLI